MQNKPLNLLINDIKKEVITVISKDKLPITIISMMINELNIQLGRECEMMIEKEKQEYEKSQKSKEEQEYLEHRDIKEAASQATESK